MVSSSLALPPHLLVVHVSRAADSKRIMSCRIQGESVHISIQLSYSPTICLSRVTGWSIQGMDKQTDGSKNRCTYKLYRTSSYWSPLPKIDEMVD